MVFFIATLLILVFLVVAIEYMDLNYNWSKDFRSLKISGLWSKSVQGGDNVSKLSKSTYLITWFKRPEIVNYNRKTVQVLECEFNNCYVTDDTSQVNNSDVLLFYHNVMPRNPPEGLSLTPKWVFVTYEAPHNTHRGWLNSKWKNKFDWTMTYRSTSEIFSPYGLIVATEKIPIKNYSEIFRKKTKDVLWIVSHCSTESKREKYVRQMKKIIQVDIFGSCGKKIDCRERCRRQYSKNYKFYLAFENSLCDDYMTEKVFDLYTEGVDMLPVIRGAPNSKLYLPNDTFIYTSDFKSASHLAEYLKKLGNDEQKYISYLREKDKYINRRKTSDMCKICKLLNKNEFLPNKKLDVSTWLWESKCYSPKDL